MKQILWDIVLVPIMYLAPTLVPAAIFVGVGVAAVAILNLRRTKPPVR